MKNSSNPKESMSLQNEEVDWEMRPGGMLVQKRENDEEDGIVTSSLGPLIKINVSHGTTVDEVKEDAEHLHMGDVKDKSKMIILEDPLSRERKLEETRKNNDISKACEAVAGVRAEVDRISERVAALETAVGGGTKVAKKGWH